MSLKYHGTNHCGTEEPLADQGDGKGNRSAARLRYAERSGTQSHHTGKGRGFISPNRHRSTHIDEAVFDDVYEVSVSQDAGYPTPVRGNDMEREGRWHGPR
jgi:hypothetical protein